MTVMRRGWVIVVLSGAFALPCAAQSAPDSVRGRVTERIVSRADPARSYALYVPSRYDRGAVWPVALVMDPRGRALIPLQRLRAAAERYGWIVFSSHGTRSDDPNAPNVEAVNAMLDDAQSGFRVDTKRLAATAEGVADRSGIALVWGAWRSRDKNPETQPAAKPVRSWIRGWNAPRPHLEDTSSTALSELRTRSSPAALRRRACGRRQCARRNGPARGQGVRVRSAWQGRSV